MQMDSYKFFFLAIFLAHGISHGQSDTLNQFDKDGKKTGYWIVLGADNPEKGYCDTCRIEEGKYIEHRKTGVWIKYYRNGNPKLIATYSKGRPAGQYTKYFETGRVKEKGTFIKNKPRDSLITYWECGNVRQRKWFNESGKEDGWAVYYHNNCNCKDSTSQIPEIIFHREQGILDVELLRYYPSGCLKERLKYDSLGSVESKEVFEDSCTNSLYLMNRNCTEYGYEPDPGPLIAPPIKPPKLGFDCNGYNKIYDKNDELWMDGLFKDCKLWKGKLYIYDSDGILTKIEIWAKGKYHSDGYL